MNCHQAWRLAQAVLLTFTLGLPFGLQPRAEQMDMAAAAAAKEASGRAARSHAPEAVTRPDTVGVAITFDVPGAAQGTYPVSISPTGTITGSYVDANGAAHGFLRTNGGAFVTFDAPAAVSGTYPASIGAFGAITGEYGDMNYVGRGFLRGRDGAFVSFDAPGAVAGGIGTYPVGIDPAGTITGNWYDANFVSYGFLRGSNGTVTTFVAPNAGTTGYPTGTVVSGITWNQTIFGTYKDVAGTHHGFLRDRHGAYTTFETPGPIGVGLLYDSFGLDLYINLNGVIAGTYWQPIAGNPFGGNYQGFIRGRDGGLTTFAAATYTPCCIWSFPNGINIWGTVIGSFNDGYNLNHGFIRTPDGTVTTFDVPGAGTGNNQGTVPLGITPAGEIMGLYMDANGLHHGFILPASWCQSKGGSL